MLSQFLLHTFKLRTKVFLNWVKKVGIAVLLHFPKLFLPALVVELLFQKLQHVYKDKSVAIRE